MSFAVTILACLLATGCEAQWKYTTNAVLDAVEETKNFLAPQNDEKNKWDYDKSWQRIESRIFLTCEEFQNENEKLGMRMCKELTRHYTSTYTVTSMAWNGVHKNLQGNQYNAQYKFWSTEYDLITRRCLPTSIDGYCRRALKCSMVERLYGYLIGAPTWLGSTPQLLSKGNVRDGKPDLLVGACMDCEYVPCEFSQYGCPNGRVVSLPAPSRDGIFFRLPVCDVSCAPGTFLTCKSAKECRYRPYTDWDAQNDANNALAGSMEWYRENAIVLKVGVNLVTPSATVLPLYGQCYPCWHAADRMHEDVVRSTDNALKEQGFLNFYCPGGASVPTSCGLNEVTKYNAPTRQSSACGCKPGLYKNLTTARCEPCPAGHFCDWDGMNAPVPRECPADHYAKSGAVACTKCVMDHRRCDTGQALTRCMQSQASEPKGKFQAENAYCVDCARCQQLQGAVAAIDAVPCYKVSPRIF